MDRERIVQVFLLGSLAVMAYELYRILQPFLVPVVWAMLLAFIFHPLMVRAHYFVRHRTFAALSITLVVALVAIVPALWLSTMLAAEARSLYTAAYILASEGGVGKYQELALHSRLGMAASRLALRAIPAPLYLAYAREWVSSVVAVVLCAVAVPVIDNLIKPRLNGGYGLPIWPCSSVLMGDWKRMPCLGVCRPHSKSRSCPRSSAPYNKGYNTSSAKRLMGKGSRQNERFPFESRQIQVDVGNPGTR